MLRRGRVIALVAGAIVAAVAGGVPARAGDEDGRSADQVLADAVTALRALPGIRVDGTVTDRHDHGVSTLHAVVSASGDARVTERHGDQTVRTILAGAHLYLRGTASFWREDGFPARTAHRLARVWVRIAVAADQRDSKLTPDDIASCLEHAHGTLSLVGPQQVDGQAAIVLADAGDVPGSAPERIAVADAAPALPLRLTLTGPRRKGIPPAADCDSSETGVASQDLRLTPLSAPPHLAAPKHFKTLRQALAGSSASDGMS